MSTIISGEKNVRAFQAIAQLHKWRLEAKMKIEFGMRPKWTIRMFNEMYGVKATSWQQVYTAADETLKAIRAQQTNS